MIYRIENEFFRAEVSSRGGELTSFFGKSKAREYIWQGDARYWSGRAPILFPICCRLWEGRYRYAGRTYEMDIHGFLKDSEPQFAEHGGDSISLSFFDTESTRAQYPFEFALRVTYKLLGKKLSCTVEAENRGDGMMFFSIGAHPGFNVPFCGGDFADYRVDLPLATDVSMVELSANKFITGAYLPYELDGRGGIPLTHDMFDDDAVFLRGAGMRAVLRRDGGDEEVVLDAPKARFMGLWHAPRTQAPYCCIEPLCGAPARDGTVDELTKKAEIMALAPHEKYEFPFSVEVRGCGER